MSRIGDVVTFIDADGNPHNALIIHDWGSSLNIVFVNPTGDNDDSFGNERVLHTSVPFFQEGMSGFYIKE